MRSLFAAGCSLFALLAAPAAWAQGWGAGVSTGGGATYSGPAVGGTTSNSFGLSNQFVLSTNLGTGFTYETRSEGGGSDFSVQVGTDLGRVWALDYFVIDNLSIGGQVSYATANDGDSKRLSVAPRVGYNIALGDDFSLWPQLTVTYTNQTDETEVNNVTVESKSSAFGLGLNVPVLYHITNHFFLGIGPFINTQLSNSVKVGDGDSQDAPKTTQLGLASVLGGYL
jgi:outer membrane protein with beta-barrel domain